MRRVVFVLVLGWTVISGPFAHGEIGTLDVVPAATLLLPYFEADIEQPDGFGSYDTRLTVRNTGAAPALAHVTFYTDYGVPTYAYDVYLTGYDVERLSLADVFTNNALDLAQDTPVTGDPVTGPTDDALFADGFESGDLSAWTTVQSDVTIDTLRAYHTGQQSPRTGLCAGSDYGDGVARGYITIDSTNQPSTLLPDEVGYFISGGNGVANNQNVLTGDFELRDDANNFSIGNPMFHIEASFTGDTATPGEYTFYSRFTSGFPEDNREPLATQWNARYVDDSNTGQDTDFIYWRDIKVEQSPITCGTEPAWVPLNIAGIFAYDEDGISVGLGASGVFPLACGRARVGSAGLSFPFSFGFVEVDFSNVNAGNFGNLDQAGFISASGFAGRFSIGYSGLPMNNALDLTP